ncbi:MAG: L-2-hydroxyglutarate oxidase [Bacteroidetes bacterium]|nr:L-2-hydroxyglutarate oxidase [Bacteroidota bacterium]
MKYDVAIIGGGILGCATAYRLADNPAIRKLIVIEKESDLGTHQTGRNSGVIHSGIYYTPGSQKAENCRVGRRQLLEFCDREGIDYEICGKVIVAVSDDEITRLHAILQRGVQNGIRCNPVDPDELAELEPHVRGIAGIRVPDTGIIDFRSVCLRLADRVRDRDHRILTNAEVIAIEPRSDHSVVQTSAGEIEATLVVNCAGLHSDRIARMAGEEPAFQIIPFRGVYYELREEARHLCNNLIYPVPDPNYPFLGVHFTRMLDGRVECGPNAVLATGREAYSLIPVEMKDMIEILRFRGFRKMVGKHWRQGIAEMAKTLSKKRYLRALQRLVPSITQDDIVRSRSGIRAQALDRNGELVDDFLIIESDRVVNVCNAPSPAATAGLRIGQLICERVASRFS